MHSLLSYSDSHCCGRSLVLVLLWLKFGLRLYVSVSADVVICFGQVLFFVFFVCFFFGCAYCMCFGQILAVRLSSGRKRLCFCALVTVFFCCFSGPVCILFCGGWILAAFLRSGPSLGFVPVPWQLFWDHFTLPRCCVVWGLTEYSADVTVPWEGKGTDLQTCTIFSTRKTVAFFLKRTCMSLLFLSE